MEYLLLLAGIFMGWSQGTNDGSNAFGTAVATGVVKYRTAITVIATFVVIGAYLAGAGNLSSVSSFAVSNEVMASEEAIAEAIATNTTDSLVLKSALKAAIIFLSAGMTVFIMTTLKMTVSSNQAITGAIIGWGLFYADYSDPEVLAVNIPQISKFAATWLLNPLGAMVLSIVIVLVANRFIIPRLSRLSHYDMVVKVGYIIAGAMASYSIGMNSAANVTALYFDGINDGIRTNLLTNPQLTATIGGLAIALGVLTYSKKVMMTVGARIVPLTPIEGFLVIIAMALTIVLMGETMGIPVSTSQALVGAIVGAGITKGVRNVNYAVFKSIAIAWLSSPLMAGTLTYIAAFLTRGFFG